MFEYVCPCASECVKIFQYVCDCACVSACVSVFFSLWENVREWCVWVPFHVNTSLARADIPFIDIPGTAGPCMLVLMSVNYQNQLAPNNQAPFSIRKKGLRCRNQEGLITLTSLFLLVHAFSAQAAKLDTETSPGAAWQYLGQREVPIHTLAIHRAVLGGWRVT